MNGICPVTSIANKFDGKLRMRKDKLRMRKDVWLRQTYDSVYFTTMLFAQIYVGGWHLTHTWKTLL